MNKHALGLLWIVLLAAALALPCGAHATETITSDIRRVVYVVLDDSTSMRSNGDKSGQTTRFEEANYAIQSLVAVLDADDELYLRSLNNINKSIETNDNLMQESKRDVIERICNRMTSTGGATPFDRVKAAADSLIAREQKDNADNVEYWLVLMSDGEFSSSTRSAITPCIFGDFLNNESPFRRFIYMRIGESTTDIAKDNRNAQGYTEYSTANASIASAMADIAGQITGRLTLPESAYSLSGDGKTLEINLPMDAKDLTLYAQGNAGGRIQARDKSGALKSTEEQSTCYPNNKKKSTAGTIASFAARDGEIDAGKVALSFQNVVSGSTLRVYYTPAIELAIDVKHGTAGVRASASLYAAGASSTRVTGALPAGSTFELTAALGSQKMRATGEREAVLTLDNPQAGRLILDGWLALPNNVRYHLRKEVVIPAATIKPTNTPTVKPTSTPTVKPTNTPTVKPTNTPTVKPTNTPTVKPTNTPTVKPTNTPTPAHSRLGWNAETLHIHETSVFGREARNGAGDDYATSVLVTIEDERPTNEQIAAGTFRYSGGPAYLQWSVFWHESPGVYELKATFNQAFWFLAFREREECMLTVSFVSPGVNYAEARINIPIENHVPFFLRVLLPLLLLLAIVLLAVYLYLVFIRLKCFGRDDRLDVRYFRMEYGQPVPMEEFMSSEYSSVPLAKGFFARFLLGNRLSDLRQTQDFEPMIGNVRLRFLADRGQNLLLSRASQSPGMVLGALTFVDAGTEETRMTIAAGEKDCEMSGALVIDVKETFNTYRITIEYVR